MLLGRISKSKKMADAEKLTHRKSRISEKKLVLSQSVEDLPRYEERSKEAIQFVLAESRKVENTEAIIRLTNWNKRNAHHS